MRRCMHIYVYVYVCVYVCPFVAVYGCIIFTCLIVKHMLFSIRPELILCAYYEALSSLRTPSVCISGVILFASFSIL